MLVAVPPVPNFVVKLTNNFWQYLTSFDQICKKFAIFIAKKLPIGKFEKFIVHFQPGTHAWSMHGCIIFLLLPFFFSIWNRIYKLIFMYMYLLFFLVRKSWRNTTYLKVYQKCPNFRMFRSLPFYSKFVNVWRPQISRLYLFYFNGWYGNHKYKIGHKKTKCILNIKIYY